MWIEVAVARFDMSKNFPGKDTRLISEVHKFLEAGRCGDRILYGGA